MYGCESWLCNNIKAAVSPILSALKQLLSVRNQTCNDLVQVELGYPGTNAVVQEIEMKFLVKLISRENFVGSPAHFVIDLARRAGAQAVDYIDALLQCEPGYFRAIGSEYLRSRVLESTSSRRTTYYEFNPAFNIHRMYFQTYPNICELQLPDFGWVHSG